MTVPWLDHVEPQHGTALREFREITIPLARSAISYATALHEIGTFLDASNKAGPFCPRALGMEMGGTERA